MSTGLVRLSTIRIMTVDDHPLLRQGIAALIKAQPDMELVAEARDGEEGSHSFATSPGRNAYGSADAQCGWHRSHQPDQKRIP